MPDRPVIVLVGPTAGGKTRLAIELARRLPGGGTCLCADSMQVYRGMDIGTAKPTPAERDAVPHRLLDVADPADGGFTVESWLRLARAEVDATRADGRWPIVVGGTNLYVRAFLEGLFDGPPADPAVRASLEALDPEALRAELERVDPDAAARIHPNDRRRTVRAIEVQRLTGTPISALQRQWGETPTSSLLETRLVGLDFPADAINRRINARVRAMIEQGLVDEVRGLVASDRLGVQAREALGYRQILDHLEGRCSLEDAVEQIKIRTRRYAKQQRTWLRRFRSVPGAAFLQADGRATDELAAEILAMLERMPNEGTDSSDTPAHGLS